MSDQQAQSNQLLYLLEIFPTLEKSLVEMIFEECPGEVDKATEQLITLCEDNDVAQNNKSTSFENVASTVLSQDHCDPDSSPDLCVPILDNVPGDSVSPSGTNDSPYLSDQSSHKSSSPFSAQFLFSQPATVVQSPSSPKPVINIPKPRQKLGLPPEPLKDLEKGHKVLVILRGLPGSGKSTLAAKLVTHIGSGIVLSTDDYFLLPNGQYKFRPDCLPEAHLNNQRKTEEAMKSSVQLVVIDNTNTQAWEMKEYVRLGVVHEYKIHLVEPSTRWKFHARQLVSKTSHGVPLEKIKMMLDRYEKNLTVDKMLDMMNLKDTVYNMSKTNIEDTSNTNTEVVFLSDEEETETNDSKSLLVLNPNVPEFIPIPRQLPDNTTIDENGLIERFPQIDFSHDYQAGVPADMSENNSTNDKLPMSLDPLFAVNLQEKFGAPLDDSLLQFLNTEDLLNLEIPHNLAFQIFSAWQSSLGEKLSSKPVLEEMPYMDNKSLTEEDWPSIPTPTHPTTVLAPNAVQYYEKKDVEKAVEASKVVNYKPLTQIVVSASPKSSAATKEEDDDQDQMDMYREQRDQLYRQMKEVSNSKVRSFYASRARELNKQIRDQQKEQQMDKFTSINKTLPTNTLDLHFLQTGDAIKKLAEFVSSKERIRGESSKKTEHYIEVITGQGNRSDNGRSRLRPAVENWLLQKGYQYSPSNSGAFRVTLGGRGST